MYNVYLLSSIVNEQKLYKIGITKRKVESRIKEFKTGNAADIKIVDIYNSKWGYKIEAYLHRIYEYYRVSGEWFNLDDVHVNLFKENCEKIDKNLNMVSNENSYYEKRGKF